MVGVSGFTTVPVLPRQFKRKTGQENENWRTINSFKIRVHWPRLLATCWRGEPVELLPSVPYRPDSRTSRVGKTPSHLPTATA